MSNDFDLSQLGFGAATRARVDANNAQQDADGERQRARTAEAALRNITTDADLQRKVRGLGIEKERLLSSLAYMQEQLKERDEALIDWMHSNEAFLRLARQYGKKAGVSDAKRQADYDEHVINISEEDPKFANTQLAQDKKLKLTK